MPQAEYMKVPIKYFPSNIQQKYNLRKKLHNNNVYIKIKKGYVQPQAGCGVGI